MTGWRRTLPTETEIALLKGSAMKTMDQIQALTDDEIGAAISDLKADLTPEHLDERNSTVNVMIFLLLLSVVVALATLMLHVGQT